jgi:benzil reductase ((S)-benzoin forming)
MKQYQVEQALVLTGRISDLGLELNNCFGQRGLSLILIGRDLGRLAQHIAINNPNLYMVQLDLAKAGEPSGAKKLTELVTGGLSKIKPATISFISNAGVINPIGSDIEGCVDSFLAATAINYLAPALIAAACSKYSRENNVSLHILNISSGAATNAIPGWATYCSTKASARMYFDVLKSERNSKITIDHFDPGVMDTQMQEEIRSSSIQSFPLHAEFVQLKVEGRLKSPLSAAIQIEEIISQRGAHETCFAR